MIVVAAVQTEPIAIPESTSTPGENERILQRPRISKIDKILNTNATALVAYGFVPAIYDDRLLPVLRKPPAKTIIETLAPKTAAFVIPSVEGDAM